LEKQEKLEHDAAKAERKAEKKAEAEKKKKEAAKVCQSLNCDTKANMQITIKRSERNKRKYVTSVHGLDYFGCDLKKVAKLFATKFATGSSVSKRADGQEEIQVQGDVTEEIVSPLLVCS
jgi:density-regulated protein DRP1